MKEIKNDEELLEFLKDYKLIPWNCKKFEQIRNYLNNRFEDSLSYPESYFRIKNKIEERPVCKVCGNPAKFYSKNNGFSSYCCVKCAASSVETREKYKQTCFKKYGVKNWFASKECKNKLKEKYGVEHGLQSRKIWEKTRESTIERYGAAYNKEQLNKTLLKKYGVKWFTQAEKLKLLSNSEEAKQKEYETKKKNYTFNSSNPENESYKLLKEKFEDTIQNYRCERYPFNCDFYIPSLDLFIECQYHWTHGGHPFDKNDKNDTMVIECWKTKNTKFYNNAINTWTIRDVNKRNTAKENNLNYLEFWNINELKEWLNNLNK